jgi:hypothetical protein
MTIEEFKDELIKKLIGRGFADNDGKYVLETVKRSAPQNIIINGVPMQQNTQEIRCKYVIELEYAYWLNDDNETIDTVIMMSVSVYKNDQLALVDDISIYNEEFEVFDNIITSILEI